MSKPLLKSASAHHSRVSQNKNFDKPRKSSLKLITETARDVANVYKKETFYPYWFAFCFYWIVLFIHVIIGGGNANGDTNKTKEN